jgi:hypothetical protein
MANASSLSGIEPVAFRRAVPGQLALNESVYTNSFRHPTQLNPSTFAQQNTQAARSAQAAKAAERRLIRKGHQKASGKRNTRSDYLHHHLDPFFHHSAKHKASLSREAKGFLLWGRINPAHCLNPYRTTSAEHYRDFSQDRDPIDRTFYTKTHNKAYKEARALSKQNAMRLNR